MKQINIFDIVIGFSLLIIVSLGGYLIFTLSQTDIKTLFNSSQPQQSDFLSGTVFQNNGHTIIVKKFNPVNTQDKYITYDKTVYTISVTPRTKITLVTLPTNSEDNISLTDIYPQDNVMVYTTNFIDDSKPQITAQTITVTRQVNQILDKTPLPLD